MKPTIVLVDDIAAIRETVRLGLKEEFEIVAQAADGRQAIEAYHQFHPDFMLMDIVMPRMSGLDAIKTISESKGKPTRIVVLSSLSDEGVVLKAMEFGAVDYLVKPPDVTVIRAVLLDIWENSEKPTSGNQTTAQLPK